MIFFSAKGTAVVQNEFLNIVSNPRFTNLGNFELGTNPLANLKEVVHLKAIHLSKDPQFAKKDPIAKLQVVFGQLVTEIAALSVQQLVGGGTIVKKPIDNDATVGVRTYLNELTQIFPIYFKVINGEGARDDSYTLEPGEIIKKSDLDPNAPINYGNKDFIELLEVLNIDVDDFKKQYTHPLGFHVTIDSVDGTTFASKGGHRATAVFIIAYVPHTQTRDGFISLPDEEYSFSIATAKGLNGIDLDYPRVSLKEIVRQTAIAKVKRDQNIDLEKIENKEERETKIHQAINQLNIGFMNRPQNMYLLQELKEAGVELIEENGEFVSKKGRTKGKDYNRLYTNHVQAVGDGNVPSFAGELDLFMGTGGATEMAVLAATCGNGKFYPLERSKVSKIVDAIKASKDEKDPAKKAYIAQGIKHLVGKIQRINGDIDSSLIPEVYSEKYIQKLKELGWTDEEIFKGGLTISDIIRANPNHVATFITAITSMTGRHGMSSAEVDGNPEKFIGSEGMQGVLVGDSDHVQISTFITAGGEQFLVTRKYETISKKYQKKLEGLVNSVYFTIQSDLSSDRRSAGDEVTKLQIEKINMVYYQYLSFVAQIGLVDLYTQEFAKYEKLFTEIGHKFDNHNKRLADMVRWKNEYVKLVQFIKNNWRDKTEDQKKPFLLDVINRGKVLQSAYRNNVEIYKHVDDVVIIALDDIIKDAEAELSK